MKNKAQLLFFLSVAVMYLTAMFFDLRFLMLIFKPLIVGSLLVYFMTITRSRFVKFKLWMILALFYCMVGDVFLMLDGRDELFFVLGLFAFLGAHIFYIFVFRRIIKDKFISFSVLKTLPIVIYLGVFLYLVLPHSGILRLSVIIYALVIGTMLVFALHLTKIGGIGRLIAAGACLFVISDSLIGFNKFYTAIPYNPWLVIVTYIAAQFLIVHGVAKYILQR